MGGAADHPNRSSSPLKRPASDLEAEESNQKDDVDMITVPEPDLARNTDPMTAPSRATRGQSVHMLKDEQDTQGTTSPMPETEIPPIDHQIATVTTLCRAAAETPLEAGSRIYLVSKQWLSRVISRGSEARRNSKVEPEGEIGPIDNSDIIQQVIQDCDGESFAVMKHGLGVESFELFPPEVWEMVVSWYGLMPGSVPILRQAHNTNADINGIPNVIYEFHPPIFLIYRLCSEVSGLDRPYIFKDKNPPTPVVVVSRSLRYVDFLKKIKDQAKIPMNKKVRVWRVPRLQPAAEPAPATVNAGTPPSSRPNSPAPASTANQISREPQDTWKHLLLDASSFVELKKGDQRELVDASDETNNQNYNGHSDLAFYGLGDNQAIVLDEHIAGNDYVSSGKGIKTSTSHLSVSKSQPNSGRSSPAPSTVSANTRGRTRAAGRALGTAGLSNLGNTCYMNSALQCVRSVEELTKYFLTGADVDEINRDNPLGNNGEVAVAYRKLLKEIYADSSPSSVAPRNFKNTIGRFAPSFSGYGQQDSQEFIGFLLDGLQEDLSRIKKKPYIEKPDSTDEMFNDPAAIREMAKKIWDITKKRDDSVIADLFTGMYKSTLVCPEPGCHKVSITFDPFNNVTLQLPIEASWSHNVFYFPLNDKPILISVDIDKQATILALKQFISDRVLVPVERIMVSEHFKCKFYKHHDDSEIASEAISSNDDIAAYELEAIPTNWPAPKKPAKTAKAKSSYLNFSHESDDDIPLWDDPLAQTLSEKMLVPVFYRRPNAERNSRSYHKKNWTLVPAPHYIVLTPEEARSEEKIKRKLLEKVATLTTQSLFHQDDETDASISDSLDPDIVLANGSDSSCEGKVVASSIDGEDGLVDITMKESSASDLPAEGLNSMIVEEAPLDPQLDFNKRRPKFVTNPGSFLEPEFQNLFSIHYFRGSKDMVPTGWNHVDEDKTYPTLASRSPQIQEMSDDDEDFGAAVADSSDEDNTLAPAYAHTRMNDAESDASEDELAPSIPVSRDLPVRPKSGARVGQKQRGKRIKTYSKKGKKQARKQGPTMIGQFDGSNDTPDDGPLIRLGEGIIVDWTEPAWDALFEPQRPDDTMRGSATFNNIPQYHDKELAAKRAKRAARRKNGITLDDCLNEFGKEEVLSEADTWFCPRCKEHRRATKKFELWMTPDILVMHLKRFSSSQYRRDKLDVLVDFPIDGLDLTSRVVETEDGKNEIYDLIAVDDHWGGLGGGHYTAFAKNFIDHEWYEYNDQHASKIKDTQKIVSSSAYLLFYRRRSEVPLGGPRFQQIINDFETSHEEASEEDVAESGEDQSLVAKYSLRGSSSALTGVGAAHRQVNLGSDLTVNPQDLDSGLPPYQSHESDDCNSPRALSGEIEMHNGLHESVEDEGIGMDYSPDGQTLGTALRPSFTFARLDDFQSLDGLQSLEAINTRPQNIVSGTGSDLDQFADRSDVVQDNSSAGASSRADRLADFDNTLPEGDDGEVFEDPSPVPDIDDDDQIDTLMLHRELMVRPAISPPSFKVPAGDDEAEIEEPATEIHVEEGEGLKID